MAAPMVAEINNKMIPIMIIIIINLLATLASALIRKRPTSNGLTIKLGP